MTKPMVTVYTACPPMDGHSPAAYRKLLIDVARSTEQAGFTGILTHTDNSTLDPWSAAQLILEHTDNLVPLVAVNPIYMHPLSAARMINTLGYFCDRRVDLNLVSGGFARHLREAGCSLDHDRRYDRLAEYGKVLQLVLTAGRPVSHSGAYYELDSANLTPRLAPELMPGFYVSGASEACRRVQRELGATRLSYPHEISAYEGTSPLRGTGAGFGIIARETAEEAWAVAHERFPLDELGEELHEYASESAESHWHRRLSRDAVQASPREDPYWLYPFRSYKTFSPYLVGSHAEVAEVLSGYLALGLSTVILDGLLERPDLHHAAIAFELARADLPADC
ncbi:LLM class flavin-dependent oxidoreductase [Amycolatopsis sp. A133]|uniref:LLM class flavin-dependent oxidoreductase n=1 Tax=Amycolatopsis sp. A133 TaxID=3064472 RepID=UPI0027F22BF0|nr:LLM class flavin-dependent oxidoreductase [Amycolatopsis sp. A133]MDQ7807553.1 LLM class flavin-dependent oxidoreductase [Amycolatopsis sp. A133]